MIESQFILNEIKDLRERGRPFKELGDCGDREYFQVGGQVLQLSSVPLPPCVRAVLAPGSCSLAGSTPWPGLWLSVDNHLFLLKMDHQCIQVQTTQAPGSWLGWHEGLWQAAFPDPVCALAWSAKGPRQYCAIAFPF